MKNLDLKSINKAYFIAEIGSNFDRSLNKAKDLISLAKESGADAVKFQHYSADSLVSDLGFKNLKNKSHQTSWSDSVYETYKKAELNVIWTQELSEYSNNEGIDFMTSPYSFELCDMTADYVSAFKIGSGDISWTDFIQYVSLKNKPLFIATGASSIDDVTRAVEVLKSNNQFVLMQCNTNYENILTNLKYQNISVLNTYKNLFGRDIHIGLSDHTKSHTSVLCAISLGAKFVEKHFTDNNNNKGPDHLFALDPNAWKEMISLSREVEEVLGTSIKIIEENEREAYTVQRRSICTSKNLKVNHIIKETDLCYLRPKPDRTFDPWQKDIVIGKKLNKDLSKYQPIFLDDLT